MSTFGANMRMRLPISLDSNCLMIIPVILLWCMDSVKSDCPDNILNAVFSCLKYINIGGSGAEGYAEVIRKTCASGSFDRTLYCVQEVFDDCANSPRLAFVKQLADRQGMRDAFRVTCDNLNVYSDYSTCIGRENPVIQKCAGYVNADYKQQLTRVYLIEERLQLTCSFIHAITRCTEEPIRYRCGDEPADLTIKLMAGITPPSCRDYAINNGVSTNGPGLFNVYGAGIRTIGNIVSVILLSILRFAL